MKCIKDLKVILRAMGFELQVNNDEKIRKGFSYNNFESEQIEQLRVFCCTEHSIKKDPNDAEESHKSNE